MKFSLREAHKLDGRIASKTAEGIKLRHTISIYDDELPEVFLSVVEGIVEEEVNNTTTLIQARAHLRRIIQEANQEIGINDTISQRKEFIEQLRVWDNIKKQYEAINVPMTADILEAKMKRQKDQGGSDLYGRNDVVEVTAISNSLYNKSVEEVRTLRRLVDECEDKLASLNAGTKIKLEDDLVTFLEEQGIL